jgi:hypothetical protein
VRGGRYTCGTALGVRGGRLVAPHIREIGIGVSGILCLETGMRRLEWEIGRVRHWIGLVHELRTAGYINCETIIIFLG